MDFFTLGVVKVFIDDDKNDGYHHYPERKNVKIECRYSVNGCFNIKN